MWWMCEMNTHEVIIVARKHAVYTESPMNSSALHCLSEAIRQYDDGFYDSARYWAVKSVRYSIGIEHPDYIRVNRVYGG